MLVNSREGAVVLAEPPGILLSGMCCNEAPCKLGKAIHGSVSLETTLIPKDIL